MSRLDDFDVMELMAYAVGMDPYDADFDESEAEDKLLDMFGVDLDQFHKLADALAKFTIATESPLSGKKYQGFVKDGAYIAKVEVKP